MKLTVIVFTFLCLTTGCATTEKYDKLLSGLVGQPESSLKSDWGEPQETQNTGNGDHLLIYNQNRSIETGGYTLNTTNNYNTGRISSDLRSATGGSARTLAMPTMPTRTVTLSCITRFTIHNGLVQAFSWEGNDCVSWK